MCSPRHKIQDPTIKQKCTQIAGVPKWFQSTLNLN